MQVLQDMIGDLTSEPEPIQIKLFSPDPTLLQTRLRPSHRQDSRVVDAGRNRKHHQRTPTTFQINPSVAACAEFPREDDGKGEPQRCPRSATIAPTPCGGATLLQLEAIRRHPAGQQQRKRPRLSGRWPQSPNFLRKPKFAGRGGARRFRNRAPEGTDLAAAQKAVGGLLCCIRVEHGGTYKQEQKSFADLVSLALAIVLVFIVLLFESESLRGASGHLPLSMSRLFAVITRTTFNVSSFMIMVVGIVAKNGVPLRTQTDKFPCLGLTAEDVMPGRRPRPIVMTRLPPSLACCPWPSR